MESIQEIENLESYLVLIIGAEQREVNDSTMRLPRFMSKFQYKFRQLLGFGEVFKLPQLVPHRPSFSKEDVIKHNTNHNADYYAIFKASYPKFMNHFDFIMVDRRTQNCINTTPAQYPENRDEWNLVSKNGVYNYSVCSYKPEIESEISQIQMTYMINNFLKIGGSFICSQKRTYRLSPIFESLFKHVRLLTEEELLILEDPDKSDNLWYLYTNFLPPIYKEMLEEKTHDIKIYKEWTCDICTFINKLETNKCEMCGTSKPAPPLMTKGGGNSKGKKSNKGNSKGKKSNKGNSKGKQSNKGNSKGKKSSKK
jgi:hypothetical protein